MSLKNKRILITAGPTWVPIDNVRVISNIATGSTGILLAEKLQKLGAGVTLLLGPVEACCLNKKIKVLRFRFFNELKNLLIKELKPHKYDILIHSAAVSDYRLARTYARKIKSGIKNWRINLVPTEKLIDLVRNIDRNLFLVGFKFEQGIGKNGLIQKARTLIRNSGLDLAVANIIERNRYQAYILNEDKIYGPFYGKSKLTDRLIKIIGSIFNY